MKLYFISADLDAEVVKSHIILNRVNNPLLKLYLEFLQFVLPIFENY